MRTQPIQPPCGQGGLGPESASSGIPSSADRCRGARAASQRGQALVEATVLAAALLPFLLAVPLIAKYQDIRHAAISAARTAAFECSIRPDNCDGPAAEAAAAGELRRRHFASHGRDLLSNDAPQDPGAAGDRNRFWVDQRGAPLLARFDDVRLDMSTASSDAIAGAVARWNTGLLPAGPGAFGLVAEAGLATASVQASVSPGRTLAQWLVRPAGLQLALSAQAAILVDAWNASSGKGAEPRSFESRVDQGRRLPGLGSSAGQLAVAAGLAPSGSLGDGGEGAEGLIDSLYTPVRELITGPLLAPVEPRGSLFRYHQIDVDVVPADRLGEP